MCEIKISLKAARINTKLSQGELAKLMGVSKSTISRWELGEIKIPSQELKKFCEICKCGTENISLEGNDCE